jgi:hypothetical protein
MKPGALDKLTKIEPETIEKELCLMKKEVVVVSDCWEQFIKYFKNTWIKKI